MEEVVAVLPDGLGDDERRIVRDVAEDLHAVFLAVNEPVAFGRVERVRALDRPAFLLEQ